MTNYTFMVNGQDATPRPKRQAIPSTVVIMKRFLDTEPNIPTDPEGIEQYVLAAEGTIYADRWHIIFRFVFKDESRENSYDQSTDDSIRSMVSRDEGWDTLFSEMAAAPSLRKALIERLR